MKVNQLYWWLIFLFCDVVLSDDYENQPTFYTKDGHLYIESANDRNIAFKITGGGELRINEMNVLQILDKKVESISQLERLQSEIEYVKIVHDDLQQRYTNINARLYDVEQINSNLTANYTWELNSIMNVFDQKTELIQTNLQKIKHNLLKNNCANYPCAHGGTCINAYESYICICPKNFEGPNCVQDVDECEIFRNTDLGCSNGATCTNTVGGYICSCRTGYSGIHCRQRTNQCEFMSSTELCGHGYCINTNDMDGFKCICNPGWTKDGNITRAPCTIDVDECQLQAKHCSIDPPVECINLPGSYMCGPCPPGYTGNGYYCVDINECEFNNGGCSQSPTVMCHNIPGSYHCDACPPGYKGDGVVCEHLPRLCAGFMGCHPLATCNDRSDRISCICPPDYSGNGFGEIGCIPVPRTCASNPCLNDGNCTIIGNVINCTCPSPFIGTRCEQKQDLCSPNPCLNGGVCRQNDARTMKSCECQIRFAGIHCQNEVKECGGIYEEETGTLNYSAANEEIHHTSRICMWTIRTNLSRSINIQFKNFQLGDASESCRQKYLELHDGNLDETQNLHRFCGNNLPFSNGTFNSVQNSVTITLRSEYFNAADGFELSWKSREIDCKKVIYLTHNQHGVIKSPGYPKNYPFNLDCQWYLYAPPGRRILIHISELSIENHTDCDHDFLNINTKFGNAYILWSPENDPTDYKYCTSQIPPNGITSLSYLAKIHFHSDGEGSDNGFHLNYAVIDGLPGCGGEYTSNYGEFHSPTSYTNSISCDYRIRLHEVLKIRLNLTEINLNQYLQSVIVYDGPDSNSPQIMKKTYENSFPEVIISQTNQLLLRFEGKMSSSFSVKYEPVCNIRYRNTTGVIEPQYIESSTEDLITCDYVIEAPFGYSIILNILEVDFEEMVAKMSTKKDSKFFQVIDYYDPEKSKNWTNIDDEFISIANQLTIRIETMSKRWSLYKLPSIFKANYTFIDRNCGGLVQSIQNGTIESTDDIYCRWDFMIPPGYLIHFEWIRLAIICNEGYVQIFDNVSSTATPKYCGEITPYPHTMGEIATVLLVMNANMTTNFEENKLILNYSMLKNTESCGGHYYRESGVIHSPGWPGKYPNSRKCEWFLTAPTGRQFVLHFKSFDTEDSTIFNLEYNVNRTRSYRSTFCKSDYLEIRPNNHSNSTIFGKFCGNYIPQDIISYSNQLYLKFVSNTRIRRSGFQIEYGSIATGCGGKLTSHRGEITSPYYPHPHTSHMECIYKITISQGSQIKLTFTDMDIENIDQSEKNSCEANYVEVIDGIKNTNDFGKFCNENRPSTIITTTSNTALIRFIINTPQNGRGFRLDYETLCNQTITSFSGTIESPNYPNDCPKNLYCVWRIEAPIGNKIKIDFYDIDFEDADDILPDGVQKCKNDHVTVTTDVENGVGQKYCNAKKPDTLVSSDNVILIELFTYSMSPNRGFRVEYVVEGCVGVFTKSVGNFSSPNYPRPYPLSTICNWTIETPSDEYSIQLTIEDMDLQRTSNCISDGLFISNYPTYEHILASFCHQSLQKKTIFGGHRMYVSFVSDTLVNGRGFNATYKFIPKKCGSTITTPHGVIYSTNYPENYPSKSTCEWLIQTDELHTISIEVVDLQLEYEKDCLLDRIIIYDGAERDSNRILGQMCNSTLTSNPTFISQSNKVLIIFESNELNEFKGFALKYKKSCGSTISINGTGSFELTNLKEFEDDGSICLWYFEADEPTQRITFTLTHTSGFLKNGINQCTEKDSQIRIFDGHRLSDDNQLLKYCGQKNVHPIRTTGPFMLLAVFESNATQSIPQQKIHFTATYSIYETVCGGTFEKIHGEIASPNYPNSYPKDRECIWEIKASPGNQLKIVINNFNVISVTDTCDDGYLELRDFNETGNIVGIYCNDAVMISIIKSNGIWVKFRSSSETGSGFLLEYNYLKDVELTSDSGHITSPLYPKNFYDTSVSYTWRILVPYGNKISLYTHEFYVDGDDDCYNFVRFYDGYDQTAHMFGDEFCGNNYQQSLTSTSNVIFIEMRHSSYIKFGTRFHFEWKSINRTTGIPFDNGTCMTTYKNNTFEFLSVDIKENDSGENCKEIVLSPNKPYHRAEFEFFTVHLEEQEDCLSDFLEIFSSKDLIEWTSLIKTCSPRKLNDMKYKGEPYLKISLVKNSVETSAGYSGIFQMVCGSTIQNTNGIIEKPIILERNKCVWNITARPGKTIQLTFDEINITKSENKCESSITLRNGFDKDSPFLGEGIYCGTSVPTIPPSLSNRVSIQYTKSRYQSKVDTFKLRFQEISLNCADNQIVLTHGMNSAIITSPNYPNVPKPFTECFWDISVPSGEKLKIEFLDEFMVDCRQEYVEIREGGTMLKNVTERFCGNKPAPIIVNDNIMSVKYFTEAIEPNIGFRMKISLTGCDQIHRSNYGVLRYSDTSLGECNHMIIAPQHSKVDIKIETTSSYPSPNTTENCLNRVEFYWEINTPNGTELILLQKHCMYSNTLIANHLTVPSHKVLIKFIKSSEIGTLNNSFNSIRIIYNATVEKRCGGDIIAEAGQLSSPGYPYAMQWAWCYWKIIVPKDRRIKIEILDYDVPNRNLLTFTNNFQHSVVITHDFNSTLYSSDNVFEIVWTNFKDLKYRGFKLKFSSDEDTICLGDINQNEGELSQLNTTEYYFCEYIRTTPFITDSSEFMLSTGTMFIDVTKALDTYVQVLVNEKTELLKWGDHKKSIKVVDQNVKIITSPQFHSPSYTIKYKIHKCGGNIQHEIDYQYTLKTPRFHEDYGQLDCAYLITVADGQTLQLNLTLVNFTLPCDQEYLNIYQGRYSSDPHIGKYCGITTNFTLVSQSTVLIEYHSDNYDPRSKYEILLKPMVNGCGGLLKYHTRYLASPQINATDQHYPNNMECIWEIHAQSNYRVNLEFYGRFNLETSENCTKDYVQVFDYIEGEENWKSFGQYCGRELNRPFNGTSSKMMVKFHSDEQFNGDGFRAVWYTACGGKFKVKYQPQYIMSPNYPENYPNNIECNYTLQRNGYGQIQLEILDMELEGFSSTNCYDYITLYFINGSLFRGPLCTKKLPNPILTNNDIILKFRSDLSSQRKGFKISYQRVFQPFDNSISNDTRIVFSSKTTISKHWRLFISDSYKVIVEIEKLKFDDRNCELNYLKIIQHARYGSTLPPTQVICDRETKHTIILVTHLTILQLYTRAPIEMILNIRYKKKCDQNIKLSNNETIRLIDMMSSAVSYATYLDCHIIVESEPDTRIRLSFDSFHVAPCDQGDTDQLECGCDYVAVYDGLTMNDYQARQYCGYSKPLDFISSGSTIFLRWVTDGHTNSTGFIAKVETIPSPCGKTHYSFSGFESFTIESPVIGVTYPSNLKCTYTLKQNYVGYYTPVYIAEFEKFDIEESDGCRKDYVEFIDENVLYTQRNYVYGTPSQQFRFCGSNKPPQHFSIVNPIRIVFQSDGDIERTGFKLIVQKIRCPGNQTELQGRIRMTTLYTCKFFITVPENYIISLYIFKVGGNFTTLKVYEENQYGHELAILKYTDNSNTIKSIFSSRNTIYVQITHVNYNDPLLDMNYIASDKAIGCGGDLFGIIGGLSSPNYGENHRHNTHCRWNITVPVLNYVRLTIIDFQFGSNKYCADNYLKVIDGRNTQTFCGGDRPSIFRSINNTFAIELKKTVNFEGIGFLAKYEAVPDGTI